MTEPVVAEPSADVAVELESPAVVAIVVTQAPADDLETTLRSLDAQDYPNLSILVVDDGGEQPLADRVAAVLPEAFYHRLSRPVGFAGAANHAATLVTGGTFLLFCSDAVELEPGCISMLIEELYRSNAGIVSPKCRQWEDPRRLDAIGMGSDQFGVQVDLVEPGDFDQEQYDAVGDVFVAPRGVQLVRSDLFAALGGFDAAMGSYNEDLDFCWRAHVAGARVVAVPSAVARRKSNGRTEANQRFLERHRLRTLLVTLSSLSLVRVLPLAVGQLVVASLYALLSGRRRQAGVAFDAMGWNIARMGEIRQRRRSLQALRQVNDREVHALQFSGSARVSTFLRGQFAVGDRMVDLVTSVRTSFAGPDSDRVRDATIVGSLLAFFLLFGSRGLIGEGVTPVGQFLSLPDGSSLLGEWTSGWRSAGTGGPANAPTAFLVLAFLRTGFFWADGLPALILTLGPLLGGVIGVWLLLRPLGSARAAALGALTYAANPVLVSLVTAGRWDSLVIWGAAPYLLGSALRLQGRAPFGRTGGPVHTSVVDRPVAIRLIRLGLLVAFVATFVPAVIVVALLVLASVALGSVLVARPTGLARLGVGAAVVVVAPAALHAPFSFDVMRRFDWAWLVGPPSPETSFDSLADLIRFAPGIGGARFLALGMLAAAAVVLVVGRGPRFDLGAQGWALALVFWMVAWSERRGWLPMAAPTAEMLLVPAAVGVSVAVGAGTRAVEFDLRGHRFGWRQVVAFGGMAAVGAAGLLLLQTSLDGRWGLPTQSHSESVSLMARKTGGPSRVLWLGRSSVVPVDTHESARGTSFAVTDAEPSALGRWVPGNYGFDAALGERLDLASAGETSRLGRLLASYGIDLIVVVHTVAPAPHVGIPRDPGGDIAAALPRQLDLQRVPGTPDLTVYRNSASLGPVVDLPPGLTVEDAGFAALLDTDLTIGQRVMADMSDSDRVRGPLGGQVLGEGGVLVAVPADGWVSSADDELSEAFDGLLLIDPGADGSFDVVYGTPAVRRLALVGQLLLVAAGIGLARGRREVHS